LTVSVMSLQWYLIPSTVCTTVLYTDAPKVANYATLVGAYGKSMFLMGTNTSVFFCYKQYYLTLPS
jgi:hypothetical protein